ncbi:GGDEF domain-containing protein [Pseudoalteromonas tunicata]|uniref:diguanylate cyclase n=1 Tax=Pseudoalteromonas tunicata D2 TaxID=87626 RepID=A4CCW4_9GAMM|nr:GGDEF domain-containing protein [Pseudoalteromonas tunicata]ATC93913.1 hypothetical protein PTUN_a1256 [Pseudoalteromonas tunicata]AXT29715.1 GGDEF domain-containing protein [Pseudoalteromonas tunicata]EAR27407.1 cyclic nucleotide phosphodiesterase, putative [Pseudoalteromonas tunicata D2]
MNYQLGLLFLCIIVCIRAEAELNDPILSQQMDALIEKSDYSSDAFFATYQQLQANFPKQLSVELSAKRAIIDSAIALNAHNTTLYPELIDQIKQLIPKVTDQGLVFDLKTQLFFLSSRAENQVEYYQEIKDLLAQAPENIQQIGYGYLLLDAASIALRLMQDEEGWHYFTLANQLAISLDNNDFWSSLENSRGLALSEHGHFEQALAAFKKSLQYKKQLGVYHAVVYANIAYNYFNLGQLENARHYASIALSQAALEDNRYVEVLIKTLLGRIEKSQGQNEKALDWFWQSLELAKQEGVRDYIFANYADSIYPLLHLGKIDQAVEYLEQAKMIEHKEKLGLSSYLFELEAVIKHHQKDYETSLMLFFQAIDAIGQKYTATAAKAAEQSRALMETQVQELENQRLRVENELKQTYLNEISDKNTWLIWLSSIVSLCLVITVVLALYARKVSKINHLRATTDELTQIANRRHILNCLNRLIKGANKTKQPLCIAMLDIDYFKKINDNFGHLAGDLVLVEVAQVAQSCLRKHDLMGRLGGEEFLFVLPNTTQQQARTVCESIRNALHTIAIDNDESGHLTVSGSFGISILSKADEKVESLIQRADTALYQAKNNGRDQICD